MKRPPFRLCLNIAAVTALALFILYVCFAEPRKLTIRRADLPLASWPQELNGFSVAVISDPHFSRGETARMRKIHRAVRDLKPDMIVLLGDYLRSDQQPADAPTEEELRLFFGGFQAACGVYAVYGNHEAFHDKKRVARSATASGVRFLRNEQLVISHGRGKFLLSGIDDPSTSDHELPEKPAGAAELPEILLSHDPHAALLFPEREITLILAGHNHGGQFCWPWGGTVYPFSLSTTWFPSGLSEASGKLVFTGNGLGTGAFSPRWNCPPEIVFLRLYAAGSVPEIPIRHPRVHPDDIEEFE